MKQRILSGLLCACLALSLVSVGAGAATEVTTGVELETAVAAGGEITVGRTFTYNGTYDLMITQDATIHLGIYTLTTRPIVISNGAKVLIDGDGGEIDAQSGSDAGEYLIQVTGAGTELTLGSGLTVRAEEFGVEVLNGGSLKIMGSTITTGPDGVGACVEGGGVLDISGDSSVSGERYGVFVISETDQPAVANISGNAEIIGEGNGGVYVSTYDDDDASAIVNISGNPTISASGTNNSNYTDGGVTVYAMTGSAQLNIKEGSTASITGMSNGICIRGDSGGTARAEIKGGVSTALAQGDNSNGIQTFGRGASANISAGTFKGNKLGYKVGTNAAAENVQISGGWFSSEVDPVNCVGYNQVLANATRLPTGVIEGHEGAPYTVAPPVKVSFDAGGGTPVPDDQIIAQGKTAANPVTSTATTPKKEGYTFQKWLRSGQEVVFSNPITKTLDPLVQAVTLTADYQINRHTITFDSNGGSAVAAISGNYGTTVTKPQDPTRTGYSFDGWDRSIPSSMPDEDLTITAKWAVNQYKITFDSDGGSAVAAIQANYGAAVTKPQDPTKAGYTFKGWSQAIPATMPAGDMNVKAQWEENRITFKNYDGTVLDQQVVNAGETPVYQGETPLREADQYVYAFSGWSPEISAASGAADYTAQFTRIEANQVPSDETSVAGDNDVEIDFITLSGDEIRAAAGSIHAADPAVMQGAADRVDGQTAADQLAQAVEELGSQGLIQEGTTVTVVRETYFHVTTTAYSGRGKTMTVLLTPVYDAYATVSDTSAAGYQVHNDPNAIQVAAGQKLSLSGPVALTMTLPDGFVESAADRVFVRQVESDGTAYYQTGALTRAGDGSYTLAFTGRNLALPMEIGAEAPAALVTANGDTIGYGSLQDAVDAALAGGGTIEALKDGESAALPAEKAVTIFSDVTVTIASKDEGYEIIETKNDDGSVTYFAQKIAAPSGGGGGGGGGSATYGITVEDTANGTVAAHPSRASAGRTVTLEVTPAQGYALEQLTVADKNGEAIAATLTNGSYTFTMPSSKVTVTATFVSTGGESNGHTCYAAQFSDVDLNEWYHPSIDYVLERGLMKGLDTGLFDPDGTATRATVVVILHRLEGEPAAAKHAPFTDVDPVNDAWCAAAIDWGVEAGIINGITDTAGYEGFISDIFAPDLPVTREQLATILYRYAKWKDPALAEDWATEMNFPDLQDVGDYAFQAMCWAKKHDIITGADPEKTGQRLLLPTGSATRAQLATVLMRFCQMLER